MNFLNAVAALSLLLLAMSCQEQRKLPTLPIVDVASAQAGVRQAIEPAYAAAKARPDDAAVVKRLGMLLHAHSQVAAAAIAYQRAAALEPGEADTSYYLGTVLAATGSYKDAIAPLRISLRSREAVAVRLRLADTLFEDGKVAEARLEYETLITADHSLAPAYFGLGRCLSGSESVLMLERAVQLFPRYGAARFALATAYRQLGQQSKASAALDNYERDKLQVPPIDDPAMAAIQALDASATGLLRASFAMERQGQLGQAAALQERAVAADPTLTQAWVNLIALYARLDQAPKAEMAYRKAIALEPNNVEALYNFGTFCAQVSRFDEARKAFETAVAVDPGNANALDSLGAIVEQEGAWDRAVALYSARSSGRSKTLLSALSPWSELCQSAALRRGHSTI